ncbi:hypothetical protein Btru_005688 [Bulinus truncatus]|nr:hypothetical protein Btru_005688 [Bulinus truncatus]
MKSENKDDKVLEYETFLNERLKQDLRNILEHRDKIYEEISEFLQLQSTIQKIKEDITPQSELKTKVDLGCNFYVQANVSDPSKIFVAIGYGFFLEMTLDEALTFIGSKTERLQARAAELTQEGCKVKAHIKLVLEGLRELQNLPNETVKPYRDVLT